MVYEHGAWAIVGAIDGAATHLAEQVALKARITLVSSGSTDKTANMASVPWMFSCLPSDEVQAPVLAEAVAEGGPGAAFVIVAAADHDSHAALVELRRALAARRRRAVRLAHRVRSRRRRTSARSRPGSSKASPAAVAGPGSGRRPRPASWASSGAGASTGGLIGGAPLALAAFGRAAGEAAEGVVAPLLWEPSADWDSFARMYENRWGEPPDHAAAQSYDAVRLVAEATRRAGLNRARIRDAVRDIAPWRGVAGIVQWDALGRNERPVGLATWRGGAAAAHPASDPMER